MRLIDADALLEKLIKTPRYFDLKFDIDDAPTIDAVPVVRCKDCIHNEWCIPRQGRSEDDYCSNGKRREL